ncbi:MAG: cysteine desulfurase [Mariprofundales bacterium]
MTTLSLSQIQNIRADFPILATKAHGKDLVYLDNAATTQKPLCVIEDISDYYKHKNSNVHRGVHYLSELATEQYEQSRKEIASFLGAKQASEIIFVRGATEAINLVAATWGRANLHAGDEVLVSCMEHHSNIVPWQMICAQTGAILRPIPIDNNGDIKLDSLQTLLDSSRVKMVGVVHLSNALGTINPVADIIRRVHAVGAHVLVDGAQSCAHLDVDVQRLNADFYVTSAHKMYGPTGIGVLYAKSALLDNMPPYQGGGDMIRTVAFDESTYSKAPYKFEAGTPNIAGAVGFMAAIKYIKSIERHKIAAHEHTVLQYALGKARETDGMRLIGTARLHASILSFVLDGVHPHDLGTILDQEGIAIRAGHHCAMPVMQFFNVPATARASLAMYNTIEEIDILFTAIHKAQRMFA